MISIDKMPVVITVKYPFFLPANTVKKEHLSPYNKPQAFRVLRGAEASNSPSPCRHKKRPA
jgi:hypothetical protein